MNDCATYSNEAVFDNFVRMWLRAMSIKWIGVAEDLSEQGVVGQPYAQPSGPAPTVANPGEYSAPSQRRVGRKLLAVAIVSSVIMWTPSRAVIFSLLKNTLLPATPALPKKPVTYIDLGSGVFPSNRVSTGTQHQEILPTPDQFAALQSARKKKTEKKMKNKNAMTNTEAAPSESASDTHLSDGPASATESEIDIKTYRELSGKI